MKNVIKITRKYGFKEIVVYFLVYLMAFGLPARIATAGVGDGGWTATVGTPDITAPGGNLIA